LEELPVLGIWEATSRSFVEEFCELQASQSGEILDAGFVEIYKSPICPYQKYELLRVVVRPQDVKRSGGDVSVEVDCLSYVLHSLVPNETAFSLLPLRLGSEELYVTNEVLGLRINRENAERYAMLCGLLFSIDPRFTFFSSISQIRPILDGQLSSEQVEGALTKLQAVFTTFDGDRFDCCVVDRSHWILGRYVTLRMPTLYEGHFYVTKLRISDTGQARMDSDEPLSIDGVFDPDGRMPYYPLDKPIAAQALYSKTQKKITRLTKAITRTLLVDKLLHIWLLPVFFFNLLLLFLFGSQDPAIIQFYRRLQTSAVLSNGALFFGTVGVSIAIFRYMFLEFAVYVRNVVPSVWGYLADQLATQYENSSQKRSAILIVVSFVELSLLAGMALSFLIYGVSNAIPGLTSLSPLTYSDSIRYMFFHLVGVESILGVSASKELSLLSDDKMVAFLVSFMFTTVILGMVGRQLRLAIAKQV
jgi:hypothetical protein